MKATITTLVILIAAPALADPGHFAEERGHTHWLAFGALALALAIGGIALRKFFQHRATARKAAERKA
jgi:hypothetical protein